MLQCADTMLSTVFLFKVQFTFRVKIKQNWADSVKDPRTSVYLNLALPDLTVCSTKFVIEEEQTSVY